MNKFISQHNGSVRFFDCPEFSAVLSPNSVEISQSGDGLDSSSVTKKLEEELKKLDALIEKLHEENEKLFDRSLIKCISAGMIVTKDSPHILFLYLGYCQLDGTVALAKSSSEMAKTTTAVAYLTASLNDFDPEQQDSGAAISYGANKLLMLVLAAVIKAGA
ncbi:unnamed protein product [Linum trigynum]|uniref:Uncharacterized protein n=1 Tax=Linum trigynum TaxID=586398 RepID=A0AAV2CGG3_9ROSI